MHLDLDPEDNTGRLGFQRTVARLIRERQADAGALDRALRRRLERWPVPALPARRACRFMQNQECIRGMIPPRVMAAMIRTVMNGWCTTRRFQGHWRENRRRFGCDAGADAIEHYIYCRQVWQAGWVVLRISRPPTPEERWEALLGLGRHPPNLAAKFALLNYGAYRAHNIARNNRHAGQAQAGTLTQAIREGATEHPIATHLITTAWTGDDPWL